MARYERPAKNWSFFVGAGIILKDSHNRLGVVADMTAST